MSGKGSGRRPAEVSEQAFADNWSRIFGSDGAQHNGNAAASKSAESPFESERLRHTYVDDATGIEVSEDWWPGMDHGD